MGYTAYINKGRKLKRARSMLQLINLVPSTLASPLLTLDGAL